MQKTLVVLIASLSALAVARGQEQKPVPKDSVRVMVPGCSKNYVFTAGRAAEDQPGGTAVPEGYGIDFVPLPSYFAIGRDPTPGPAPRFAVVSATLLAGSYLRGDPYARLRGQQPVAIVGGSLYVFDLQAVK